MFKKIWVLWQNARNLFLQDSLSPFTRELADSKMKTKDFFLKHNIASPRMIAFIKTQKDLDNFDLKKLVPPFVIKPNKWSGWKWIIIINSKSKSWDFIDINKNIFSKKDLKLHMYRVLEWFFSLSWARDNIIIEEKIELDESIALLWKFGLPDIRLISYNMIPLMAMIRIPTRESWWTANIHQWACWAWIDISDWSITHLIKWNKTITSIPDIWDIRWLVLPNWDKVLKIWALIQENTDIKYLATDIVLDKEKWPLVLEINVRAWLSVQIANLDWLQTRITKIQDLKPKDSEKAISIWKHLFWRNMDAKIHSMLWKKLIWNTEYINLKIWDRNLSVLSRISPQFKTSSISLDFLKRIENSWFTIWDKKTVKLNFKLQNSNKNVLFKIEKNLSNDVILWRNALSGFLIDPFKFSEEPIKNINILNSKNAWIRLNNLKLLQKVDKSIINIDKKLWILSKITPINLSEERIKFIDSNWEYIPKFEYKKNNKDYKKIKQELDKITLPEVPLIQIYKKKIKEINLKLNLLRSMHWKNNKLFTDSSKLLFWSINKTNREIALDNIKKFNKNDLYKWDILTWNEVIKFIEQFLNLYNIDLEIKVSSKMVSRFSVSLKSLKIRPDIKITRKELRSVIAHEIETHYLRRKNSFKFPLDIFQKWWWFYLETEEWLAIYNQNRFLDKSLEKFFWIYRLYEAIYQAERLWYKEWIAFLKELYNNDLNKIFTVITRLKRGLTSADSKWIFYKDALYLNWYLKVKDYIKNDKNAIDLYIAKLDISDIELILKEKQNKDWYYDFLHNTKPETLPIFV